MKKVEVPLPLIALWSVLSVILIAALGYGAYRYQDTVATHNTAVTTYEAQIAKISTELSVASSSNADLAQNLANERERNDAFSNQIEDISGKVHVLDKLAKTDPELLAKYSKVYFLNENYAPPRLATIPKAFYYDETRSFDFHADAINHLEDMLEDADDDEVKLFISSAYRSFTTQAGLKSSYRVTYGAGANAFSADQGYSEHQLGTTLDFTTTGINGGLDGFDKTDAFTWLQKNAYKYGFILSYPAGNAFYVYEPWHWRYVGIELAKDLHKDGKNFYDLDQREIDTYLVNIFD